MSYSYPRIRYPGEQSLRLPNRVRYIQTLQNMRTRLRSSIKSRNRGMYTLTQRRRRGTSGQGITNQYDRSRIYRKSRMPRFRRRRWRRFNRRVNAVSEKDLGSRTVVRNNLSITTAPMDPAGEQQHAVFYHTLYGLQNATFGSNNDINEMSQDSDLGSTGKAIFKSAVLDLTFRNTSIRAESSTNPPITLEVDVYEISVGVLLSQTGKANTIAGIFAEGSSDTGTIPGQVQGLAINQRGTTPWDFPSALSEYRVKIWKKTKYFLGENQTFTYQLRDPKRHVLDKQTMAGPGENIPYLTRYIYYIFKPTPGYAYVEQPNNDIYSLSCGVTRKYLYKIMDKTQDYDMYNI